MRVSLEKKIEYLARVCNFKITRTHPEYILIIFKDGVFIEKTFESKSVSRIVTQAYEYESSKCTCVENMGCSFCK